MANGARRTFLPEMEQHSCSSLHLQLYLACCKDVQSILLIACSSLSRIGQRMLQHGRPWGAWGIPGRVCTKLRVQRTLKKVVDTLLTACSKSGQTLCESAATQEASGRMERTWRVCAKLRVQRTMRKVVEESRPVLISSRNSVFLGPTIISPGARNVKTVSWTVRSCSRISSP